MPTLFPWICLICLRRLQIPWTVESLLFIFKWLGAWHVLNKYLFIAYRVNVLSSYSLNTAGQPHCHSIRVQMVSVCLFLLSFFFFFAFCFRLVLYTPVSTSSGLFYEEMFCQIRPQLCFPLPGLPVVLSQKALCLEQTDSNLHVFLCTPTGLPGDQPSASLGAAVEWSRAAGRDCVCSYLV